MSIGIVGTKGGMTRVFDDAGAAIPVTVIEARPNRVVQVKHEARDSYAALQVAYGEQKAERITRPIQGHYQASYKQAHENESATEDSEPGDDAEIDPEMLQFGRGLHEFRTDSVGEAELAEAGSTLTVKQFTPGQAVDIRGTSKGKGFAGTVKRWNFKTQDTTHGNSLSHRSAGAIGQCQTPGKVFKGKKMAGHLGNRRVTIQNLEVVAVDEANNLLLIKGAVPGPTGGDVIVMPAVKQKEQGSLTAS